MGEKGVNAMHRRRPCTGHGASIVTENQYGRVCCSIADKNDDRGTWDNTYSHKWIIWTVIGLLQQDEYIFVKYVICISVPVDQWSKVLFKLKTCRGNISKHSTATKHIYLISAKLSCILSICMLSLALVNRLNVVEWWWQSIAVKAQWYFVQVALMFYPK